MNQSLVFKTEKVTERITRIYAFATELMYLVEGTEKAVLIDTGSGIGSLKACVEQLTDKPVVVLVTHGHVDHAMGAAEIEDVIQVCEDIKAGRADDIPFEFLGTTGLVAKAVDPSRGERGNIVYNKDRI